MYDLKFPKTGSGCRREHLNRAAVSSHRAVAGRADKAVAIVFAHKLIDARCGRKQFTLRKCRLISKEPFEFEMDF